jgi:hypothetical protein
LLIALGTTEARAMPELLLGFNLFHLKDDFVTCMTLFLGIGADCTLKVCGEKIAVMRERWKILRFLWRVLKIF